MQSWCQLFLTPAVIFIWKTLQCVELYFTVYWCVIACYNVFYTVISYFTLFIVLQYTYTHIFLLWSYLLTTSLNVKLLFFNSFYLIILNYLLHCREIRIECLSNWFPVGRWTLNSTIFVKIPVFQVDGQGVN